VVFVKKINLVRNASHAKLATLFSSTHLAKAAAARTATKIPTTMRQDNHALCAHPDSIMIAVPKNAPSVQLTAPLALPIRPLLNVTHATMAIS